MNKKILAFLITFSLIISACSLGGSKDDTAVDDTTSNVDTSLTTNDGNETDSNVDTSLTINDGNEVDANLETSLSIKEDNSSNISTDALPTINEAINIDELPVIENSKQYEKLLTSNDCDTVSADKKAECIEVMKIKATIDDAKVFKNYTFCEMIKVQPYRTECEDELKNMGVKRPAPVVIKE